MAEWHHRCNGHELGQTLGEVRDREAWLGSQRVQHDWMTEQKQQQSSKIYYGDGHVSL